MNSAPMILRFCSGSVTPASFERNCSCARTCTSGTWKWWPKASSTCSPSFMRSMPWSTNTQVRLSPMARCTSSAATALSTPPDSPQMAFWSPTCSRMRLTWSSMTFEAVHVGARSQASNRNAFSRSVPKGVCTTSGWNCTPKRRPARSSMAAMGAPAVSAVTVKPSGAVVTASRWLIQQVSAGRSRKRPSRECTRMSVRPNSPVPLLVTTPPRAWAIDCMP